MGLAALCALVAVGLSLVQAAADPPPPPAYRDAVQQAYDIISGAQPTDPAPAARAEAVLAAGTGDRQPEISADLATRPPDYEDARNRLKALLTAVDNPAKTDDPALAATRLHQVLAMHRYDALHQPPSLIDRLLQWLGDRLNQLLGLIGQGSGSAAPPWILIVIGAVLALAVAAYIVRSMGGRLGRNAVSAAPHSLRPAADYFAEADRLAAAGDRLNAVRALCAGVAATLAGERTWDGSPLTVREIFKRAPDFAALRPLLAPFEAAVYGGRDVDGDAYRAAAAAAEPFRRPLEVAA